MNDLKHELSILLERFSLKELEMAFKEMKKEIYQSNLTKTRPFTNDEIILIKDYYNNLLDLNIDFKSFDPYCMSCKCKNIGLGSDIAIDFIKGKTIIEIAKDRNLARETVVDNVRRFQKKILSFLREQIVKYYENEIDGIISNNTYINDFQIKNKILNDIH